MIIISVVDWSAGPFTFFCLCCQIKGYFLQRKKSCSHTEPVLHRPASDWGSTMTTTCKPPSHLRMYLRAPALSTARFDEGVVFPAVIPTEGRSAAFSLSDGEGGYKIISLSCFVFWWNPPVLLMRPVFPSHGAAGKTHWFSASDSFYMQILAELCIYNIDKILFYIVVAAKVYFKVDGVTTWHSIVQYDF